LCWKVLLVPPWEILIEAPPVLSAERKSRGVCEFNRSVLKENAKKKMIFFIPIPFPDADRAAKHLIR
ncbi:MAG: hypothetical protein MUF36_12890, partial [Bacteroidales bacterium]|nr:hypothetical protein [Bacteroidales bacterium]